MTYSDEYTKGFQAGWKAAQQAVWRNRNHHRALSGYAPETQDEAMARIYSSWPAPPPAILAGAEHRVAGEPIKRTVDIMLDSIDLYVVLPSSEYIPIPQKPTED